MAQHGNQSPVEIDPQTLSESEKLWGGFLIGSKYLVFGVVVILLLMAIFLA